MNEKLPDNIIRFDCLKIDYNRRKLCECENPRYVIDDKNKMVNCEVCGAVIEPYAALENLARILARKENRLEQMLAQAKELANYKPHLRIIKDIERKYRQDHFSMIPICPHCKEPFDLAELSWWVNRGLYPKYKK